MKIVREIISKKAIYLFPDFEPIEITAKGMITPNMRALDIRSDTHEVVEGAAPALWVGGALSYSNGVWAVSNEEIYAARLAVKKIEYIAKVKTKAKQVRDGGAIINGMEIATDAEARSLLTGAKVHPRATRKIVAKGGRTILTEAAYNAVVQGVADFLQAVFDKEYDLLELIDVTADADLAALDLDSGWPV